MSEPRSYRRAYRRALLVAVLVIAAALPIAAASDSTAVGVALALACTAALTYPTVVWWQREHATQGVEARIATESAAFAFHAMMLATATYWLFEQFAGAPRISMYVPFAFGSLAWAATWVATRRSLT
jgi:hypothetical protein